MSERSSSLGSATGVLVAVVGTASHDMILQVLGAVIALLFHLLTEWSNRRGPQRDTELVEYLKVGTLLLETELAKARAIGAAIYTPPATDTGKP